MLWCRGVCTFLLFLIIERQLDAAFGSSHAQIHNAKERYYGEFISSFLSLFSV